MHIIKNTSDLSHLLTQRYFRVYAMPAAIRVADAGMRGAFGKPYGKVARVDIGQVLLSMRCREDKTESAQEARSHPFPPLCTLLSALGNRFQLGRTPIDLGQT